MLFWVMAALGKDPDVDFGGALDLQAAAFIPDSGPIQSAAGWQAEGDLVVRPDGFRFTAELEFGGATGVIFPQTLTYLSPERLSFRVGLRKWWFEGGVLPPPWGMESPDPWRNALISWSALRRPGAASLQGPFGADGLVPLGALIGGGLGLGDRDWGVTALAGLDLPGGINFLGAPLEDIRNSTLLIGGQGYYVDKKVTVNGGIYAHPFDYQPLIFDVGAQFRPQDFWLTGELAASVDGVFGLAAQGEMLPGGKVSPVLRLEATNFEGLGASLGVNANFWKMLRLKAEVRYAGQTPSLWAEATLFTPEQGNRILRPGW